ADVNGDGLRDIITGAGAGGAPIVRVLSGQNGQELLSFMGFDSGFTGGVTVAAGDVDGDGKADIIVGAGAGGAPAVRVFNGASGSLLHTFTAFDGKFSGGVTVAAADVSGDNRADVIVGAGTGGGPIVQVLDGTSGAELNA